jgi:HSP20 family protein
MPLPAREPGDPSGESRHREFENLLARFLDAGDVPRQGATAPFGVDITEDEQHLYVEADMPGFRREEIDLNIEHGVLTIHAERHHPPEAQPNSDEGNYLLHERLYERFDRSFALPASVDEDHVDARLSEGILKITMNKRDEPEPHRIIVQ